MLSADLLLKLLQNVLFSFMKVLNWLLWWEWGDRNMDGIWHKYLRSDTYMLHGLFWSWNCACVILFQPIPPFMMIEITPSPCYITVVIELQFISYCKPFINFCNMCVRNHLKYDVCGENMNKNVFYIRLSLLYRISTGEGGKSENVNDMNKSITLLYTQCHMTIICT